MSGSASPLRLMLHFAPDLESLTLMQKVEAFKHVLAHTEGMDLYRVLWMKALYCTRLDYSILLCSIQYHTVPYLT